MHRYLYLILIYFLITPPVFARKTVRLKPGEVGIFGFGSLVSKSSMEKTLCRKYGPPVIITNLIDHKRSWNIQMTNEGKYKYFFYKDKTSRRKIFPKNIIYLNIQPAPGKRVSGAVFIIKKSDLPGFDKREWIYNRRDVTNKFDNTKFLGGKVYAYIGKHKHLILDKQLPYLKPQKSAIRKSYLGYIQNAFKKIPGYKAKFMNTTIRHNSKLVIPDQKDTSRPNPFGYKPCPPF